MEEKSKLQKKQTKEETSNQNNLWNEILREALTKKDLEQSHLFIFGDKNCGKKSIIKTINKDLLNKNEEGIFNIYVRLLQKDFER